MKTSISYFLFALSALSVVTAIKPVLDTDGNELISTASYYVLPFVKGEGGGGVTLGTTDDYSLCPDAITQALSDTDMGHPVKFSNWISKVAFVPQNTDLNIETDRDLTICMRPTYWWVNAFNVEMKHRFLSIGPKPREEDEDFANSRFQIEEVNDEYGYVIKICSGGFEDKPFCSNVGVIVEYDDRLLAITDEEKPFIVQFKKAQFKKAQVIETVLSNKM